jgi:hypothetical protein
VARDELVNPTASSGAASSILAEAFDSRSFLSLSLSALAFAASSIDSSVLCPALDPHPVCKMSNEIIDELNKNRDRAREIGCFKNRIYLLQELFRDLSLLEQSLRVKFRERGVSKKHLRDWIFAKVWRSVKLNGDVFEIRTTCAWTLVKNLRQSPHLVNVFSATYINKKKL